MIVALPVFALLYGLPEPLLPGFALALNLPFVALQAPVWILYRQLDFKRQRMLQSIDPVIATVALERDLIREMAGYLRGGRRPVTA